MSLWIVNGKPITCIKRYEKPHKYDQVPYGTLCKVNKQVYRQNSLDEESPEWVVVDTNAATSSTKGD